MKICSALLLLLLPAGTTFAFTLPAQIAPGQVFATAIADLHPTQATLGWREMDYKLNRYRHQPEKMYDDWCESAGAKGVATYNDASTLVNLTSFSCKAAPGTDPAAMKTVVIAPDNQLYLTDGHHTFSIFADQNQGKGQVYVRITDDFRQLKDMTTFWQQMQQKNLVWLGTAAGILKPQQLPASLGRAHMANDEYRSLVYFARDVGFDKPASAVPFLEFYWGDWLAKRLPLNQLQLNDRAGYADAVRKVADQMTTAAPDTVITSAAGRQLTAAEMGQLPQTNQKAMRKLLSAKGKLTYAFAD